MTKGSTLISGFFNVAGGGSRSDLKASFFSAIIAIPDRRQYLRKAIGELTGCVYTILSKAIGKIVSFLLRQKTK